MLINNRKKSTVSYNRWYTVQTLDNRWCVVCTSKAIKPRIIGPVQLSGKSYYQDSLEFKSANNHRILTARQKLRESGIGGKEIFMTDHGETLLQVIERIQTNQPNICLNDLISQLLVEFGIKEEFRNYMVGAVERALNPEPEPIAKPPFRKKVKYNVLIVTWNGTYYSFQMDEVIWKKVIKCETGEIESIVERIEELAVIQSAKSDQYGNIHFIDTNFALPTDTLQQLHLRQLGLAKL
jgi:hypothetical protein